MIDRLVVSGDDPDDQTAGRADGSGETVHVGDDLARFGNFREGDPRHHEAVLQIDDDQRGARRIEIFEYMLFAATLDDAVDNGLRNGNFVHGTPPFTATISLSRACAQRYRFLSSQTGGGRVWNRQNAK